MILVFDWETTGLTLHPDADIRRQPRAIEFGGVLLSLETGAIEEECSALIDPEEPITEEITKITGITDADVKGAPTFVQFLPTLTRFFSAATAIVSHNLPFDKSILRGELARAEVTTFHWPEKEMCTVGIYAPLWGKNPRLIELYESVIGHPLAQTHRALDDVKAVVEIMHKEELWRLLA